MNIDCLKKSNTDDLAALLTLAGFVILFGWVLLAAFFNNYFVGFLAAMIIWKWQAWIYKPINATLKKLWK